MDAHRKASWVPHIPATDIEAEVNSFGVHLMCLLCLDRYVHEFVIPLSQGA
jgi:hypothetical protein